ncbi:MAG: SprT family zinc-dependent metalloprotease [Candidatus Saccharimonadales bacterium]
MSSHSFVDQEFGVVTVRKVPRSTHIKLRVNAHGAVSATMPRLAPLYVLKQFIDSSRADLRKAIASVVVNAPPLYKDGDQIGSSHRIVVEHAMTNSARVSGQTIVWKVKPGANMTSPAQQDIIRRAVRKALDVEAKAYLPRRLSHLAERYGFTYSSVRYSNAKGRWGSCSSRGVISLNVALMRLPMQYVDYVLVHELAHTKHLNHSLAFWTEVARCYPDYKAARKALKTYNPYL